ncbi:GSCOCG00011331001-RA-CDS, partial [Cotesia congregata]
GGKRSRDCEEEGQLAKDKKDREVIKKSRLQIRGQGGEGEMSTKDMEALMKKLNEIDGRIKAECKKVSDEVGQLREEGRREREEFKRKWQEEKSRIDKETEERLMKLEFEAERREREVRRKNVVVKGINVKERIDWKAEVDKVWDKMEIGAGRKNMRKIGGIDKEGKGLVLVELEDVVRKKEVMIGKSKLKREKIRVEDDLTYEERRVRRFILEEAMKERRAGKVLEKSRNKRIRMEVGKKGKGGKKTGEKGVGTSTFRIGFWNVAGIKNKEEDFWRGLRNWDVVVLTETWINNKNWVEIKDSWKKGENWDVEGWVEKEEWKNGVIVPIKKKGDGSKVEDYRGITIMQTAYKVYVGILERRLKVEVEGKGLLPESQAGFRAGRGTIDNIYVLNYLINREIGKVKGKMVVLFVDFKVAFNSVDRVELSKALRRRGVSEGLVRRCEVVLRETCGKVRIGKELGERFWTMKGVRQGCPLSPLLFVLFLADLDEELEKGRWGGVELSGGKKVFSLAYADDVVLLAKEEDEMREMIRTLERFVEKKRLEVNVGKTKVMRCRKGGGRKKRVRWEWNGREIEEVSSYTYLGYLIRTNGEQGDHVRESVEKGARILGQIWGIGKRKFGNDWARRVWLFDRLVWSVMSYGVEIWGWRGREEMKRVQERYLR